MSFKVFINVRNLDNFSHWKKMSVTQFIKVQTSPFTLSSMIMYNLNFIILTYVNVKNFNQNHDYNIFYVNNDFS